MAEKFVIVQSFDPEAVAEHVSSYIEKGWTLHGDLKLQVVADGSSPTLARVVYVQAMVRYGTGAIYG